jgi:hypothetical protein
MEWISVKDKLPKEDTYVLVWQSNLVDKASSRWHKAYYFSGYFKIYPMIKNGTFDQEKDFINYDLEGDKCQITHFIDSPEPPIK